MNPGIERRNRKRANTLKRCNRMEPNQWGLCRFIKIKYEVFERNKGKWRHVGQQRENGLQIENRVYLITGQEIAINAKTRKVVEVYDDVPDWAPQVLLDAYNQYKQGNRKEAKDGLRELNRWRGKAGKMQEAFHNFE